MPLSLLAISLGVPRSTSAHADSIDTSSFVHPSTSSMEACTEGVNSSFISLILSIHNGVIIISLAIPLPIPAIRDKPLRMTGFYRRAIRCLFEILSWFELNHQL